MPTIVSKELTSVDFRQNYFPDPAWAKETQARHWLLDNSAGRDLLKAKLMTVDPFADVGLVRIGPTAEAQLDGMIDQLGLRDLAEPTTRWERLKVEFMLLKVMAALAVGLA
jgi:hypothetical protein